MKCFILGLLLFPMMAWEGFVLSELWHWFVHPLGLPDIQIWHAAGISLLVGFVTYQRIPGANKESEDDRFGGMLAQGTIFPLLMLLLGACAHWFM